MRTLIYIALLLGLSVNAQLSYTLYTIDCSGTDTTGSIRPSSGKWSIEILSDSVTHTPQIDFRMSNKTSATFSKIPAIVFSNETYDSLPYTCGVGKPNYSFSYDYCPFRYIYYHVTCAADTGKVLFYYCK